jgi:hypothetical protein
VTTIDVSPISSGRDNRAFILFPWSIYRDYPYWVPPLRMDRRKLMDRKKNPFYQNADAEFFLARRDGKIVGRIGAIVSRNHNREHNENIGFFGFFESIDDQSVANALLDTARKWLKERKVTAMRGPATPSVNDEYGLLVDGFDDTPAVLMPYNPPYYARLIENAGLKKIKDLFCYEVQDEQVFSDGRLARVAEAIRQREGMMFRALDMGNFRAEVDRIKDLYNRAWQHNWGAVPMTDAEFEALAKDLKPVVNPELVIMAEKDGEPVGFALSLPDLNQAFKYNRNGYLLPGLWCLWRYKKKITRIRIIVLGVIPEKLKSGAGSVLFFETAKRSVEQGYKSGEAGWVLEDNVMMNRAAEFLKGRRTKTFRLYETSL